MFYYQIQQNIKLNWINYFIEQNKSSSGDKVQDCKDRSGLQFINFDFMTGGQGIKLAILMEF